VCRVRAAPVGTNKYVVWKKLRPDASAVRIHQKFQRKSMLSPGPGPGRCVWRCRTSGKLQTTAMVMKAPAAAMCRSKCAVGAVDAAVGVGTRVALWFQPSVAATVQSPAPRHRVRPVAYFEDPQGSQDGLMQMAHSSNRPYGSSVARCLGRCRVAERVGGRWISARPRLPGVDKSSQSFHDKSNRK
jgi:hypothetical protein